MVTDYDVWAEKPVTAEEVARVMAGNVDKAKKILLKLIPELPPEPPIERCSCCESLKTALV
jgi:5'-methylthioadenosine phosphorylase